MYIWDEICICFWNDMSVIGNIGNFVSTAKRIYYAFRRIEYKTTWSSSLWNMRSAGTGYRLNMTLFLSTLLRWNINYIIFVFIESNVLGIDENSFELKFLRSTSIFQYNNTETQIWCGTCSPILWNFKSINKKHFILVFNL